MYKNLALINGAILAVMIFFNGMLSSITGPYMSTLIFHGLGLVLNAKVDNKYSQENLRLSSNV